MTRLCVTSSASAHLGRLRCQLMEREQERDIQPQPGPEIDRKVETLAGGVSPNSVGGLYCDVRLSIEVFMTLYSLLICNVCLH